MHYNTAMIAFVVGANALKLNSRLETEDFWSDALDFVVDTGTNIGEGFVDVGETLGQGFVDAGEYIISADGLSEDLETFGKTVTSADFWEQDMKNVGAFIISCSQKSAEVIVFPKVSRSYDSPSAEPMYSPASIIPSPIVLPVSTIKSRASLQKSSASRLLLSLRALAPTTKVMIAVL